MAQTLICVYALIFTPIAEYGADHESTPPENNKWTKKGSHDTVDCGKNWN